MSRVVFTRDTSKQIFPVFFFTKTRVTSKRKRGGARLKNDPPCAENRVVNQNSNFNFGLFIYLLLFLRENPCTVFRASRVTKDEGAHQF